MAQTSPHQVILSDGQRRELERRAAAYSGSYRDVVRAKAILLAAEGLYNSEIAERLGQSRQAVSTWRKTVLSGRAAGSRGETAAGLRTPV
jgi:DNA-binding NarL/FixJ family response regulator